VLSVINDIKLPVLAEDGTTIISYTAVVISATDYSAFGVALYGRTWSSENYRYGFNGKEKDSETTAGAYDFGARIYDGRLGRWLSVDALSHLYPSASPYSFAAANPILFVDPDGNIIRIYLSETEYYDYTPGILPKDAPAIVGKVHDAVQYNMNSAKGAEVWNSLHQSEYVTEIRPSTDTDNRFDSSTAGKKTTDQKTIAGTIHWDINSAATVISQKGVDDPNDGAYKGDVSPATTLIHEAGHAAKLNEILATNDAQKLEDWKQSHNSESSVGDDLQYDNKEERRNITEVEQVYIKEINAWEQTNKKENAVYQPVRYNHKGMLRKDKQYDVLRPKDLPDKGAAYKEWKKLIAKEKDYSKIEDGTKESEKVEPSKN
jgi:RHS repeat-associated protein